MPPTPTTRQEQLEKELDSLRNENLRIENERLNARLERLEEWRLDVIARIAVLSTKMGIIGAVCGVVSGAGGALIVKLVAK